MRRRKMRLYDQNIWGNFGRNEAVGNRCDLIYRQICAQKPDICCFQECNPQTMRMGVDGIQNLLAEQYDEICAEKADVNFTPVFIRKDMFAVLESGYFPYAGLNDLSSKSVTYAVLKERVGGNTFAVASTHFWWQPGEEADRQRKENASELGVLAERLHRQYGVPFLVAGDFNSGYSPLSQGPVGYEQMLALGFQNVRATSKTTTQTHTCRDEYPEKNESGCYANGKLPTYTIDYIFTYGHGISGNVFAVLTNQSALNSSDHCPLVFDFEIMPKTRFA